MGIYTGEDKYYVWSFLLLSAINVITMLIHKSREFSDGPPQNIERNLSKNDFYFGGDCGE